MNKTELIDKLLHLGNTTEMCCSTDRHNAKELAHTLLDEYLQAINDTHCCNSDIEQLKDEEIPKIDDWIKDLGYTQITFSYVYKKEGTYKDREQLCKEYKKEFCL